MKTVTKINIETGIIETIEVEDEPLSEEDLYNLKEAYRKRRNELLTATDWVMLTDVNIQNKEQWVLYRQQLRDVPEQEGFPENIVWPTPPQ